MQQKWLAVWQSEIVMCGVGSCKAWLLSRRVIPVLPLQYFLKGLGDVECHVIWQWCGKRVYPVVLWLLEYAY